MSIIRIVEGEYKTEIDGSWTVYTDEFEASAGQTSYFTAGEGTVFGEPELPPIPDIHITKLVVNTDQDDGILESGEKGKGLVYGKIYEIEAVLNTDDWNWATVDQIKWQYKYTNEKGKTVSDVIKNRYTGKPACGNKIDFTLPATDCCGNNITIEATLNNTASTQVWAHYRFRWFDREIVYKQAEDRSKAPWMIKQGGSSLCGMAALYYILIKKDPALYLKIAKELFRKGECKANDFIIKPHDEAISMYDMNPNSSDYNTIDMPCVDWIVLATTRSREAFLFDNLVYKGIERGKMDMIKAVNWPDMMEMMTQKVANYSNVNMVGLSKILIQQKKRPIGGRLYDRFSNSDLEHLQDIEKKYKQGHKIMMMIDVGMIEGDVSYSYSDIFTDSHWIVYEGGLQLLDKSNKITNDLDEVENVSFKIYTWGLNFNNDYTPESNNKRKEVSTIYKFLYSPYQISAKSFKSNFYGYIEAY